jgi:fatty acid amide hydrolase
MASGNRPAPELIGLNASEIARLVAQGEVSAAEAVEAHIQRIEAVNPRLNAVVVKLYEQARAEARAQDEALARGEKPGPLGGVPITIKDSIDVGRAPSTYGLEKRARLRALEDSPNVARLRRAGAIVLGKTNVPQLLMANESDNPLYGRTNNPWSLDRSPGGSSGGEAAILAAGGSALGLGSDSGGSLRLPANACGVAALKPTSNRLTLLGQLTAPEPSFSQPGPLARTAADLALALGVLVALTEERDPNVPPVEWRDPERVELRRLRVAFHADNGVLRPAPAVRRAVEEAARALAAQGAAVEEWTPIDAGDGWDIYQRLLMADGLVGVREALRGEKLGAPIRGLAHMAKMPWPARRLLARWLEWRGEARLADGVRRIERLPLDRYRKMVRLRDEYRRRFLAEMDRNRFDAIVCPANALPALPHAGGFPLGDCLSYAALFNLLGMPAGVIPATRVRPGEESDRREHGGRRERAARRAETGSAGLPVGVQVVARHWREDVVLRLMMALEEHFAAQQDFPRLAPV